MTVKIPFELTVTRAEVEAIENFIDHKVSSDYKVFLVYHNGAEPETNVFSIDLNNESGVNRFIPIHRLTNEYEAIKMSHHGLLLPIAYGLKFSTLNAGAKEK
jgi:hypothetical protein